MAMLSLGMFAFELGTLPYQELARRTEWRFGATARVGARDASQFLGPGGDMITLTGWIAPTEIGDATSLDTLREMADGGDAWPLVDGSGAVHGAFIVTNIDERRSVFLSDGTPRRIEFSIELRVVDG